MLNDEFGPWVEHHGRGMPVPPGTVVEAECENVTGKIVYVVRIAGATGGLAWNWNNFGKITVWRALRYRIRKPRGMADIEKAIRIRADDLECA